MPDDSTPWVVKGVSAETRKKIKLYAVEHDIPMGKAIDELVARAQSPQNVQPTQSEDKWVVRDDPEGTRAKIEAIAAEWSRTVGRITIEQMIPVLVVAGIVSMTPVKSEDLDEFENRPEVKAHRARLWAEGEPQITPPVVTGRRVVIDNPDGTETESTMLPSTERSLHKIGEASRVIRREKLDQYIEEAQKALRENK